MAHEKQKANEKKARQARPTVKDMRLSETIGPLLFHKFYICDLRPRLRPLSPPGDHDMQIKVKKVREFLTKGYQVRIFMNNFKE